MTKKIKIDIDFSEDNLLIGISCHKKDYWLAFKLNDILNFDLIRIDDIPVYNSKQDILINYPLFYFNDPETQFSYYFFSNHNPQGKLFISQKTTDYFLLVNGRLSKNNKTKLISSIKKIKNVLTAFEIELAKIKDFENFISDLELHILERSKTQK